MKKDNNQQAIIGAGSALVDVLIRLKDDSLLEKFGLPKGSMTLVDADLSAQMKLAAAALNSSIETGGSAANTARAIAEAGGQCGYLGKISDDEYGRFFKEQFEKIGISNHLYYSCTPTGNATALISPDAERTFGTFLGAASELTADEISDEIFENYRILHIEGYLVFNEDLIEGILKKAKSKGLLVSIDMASFNVVEAKLDFLKRIVKEYVDIVFANEEEAKSFTGLEPMQAVAEIAKQCRIAVVKIGKEGSLIQSAEQFLKVKTPQVKSVDTTGAGDVYAAGFLLGLTKGFSLESCGVLGSLMASKVIQVFGAKIPDSEWPAILSKMDKMS
ncbi:adenosine kinase [Sunxiuqinia sp. A32]|uniref:adenosine kinase n=1 Tax=Sunxiuqinia sp. A32 TaxID=3461496 RepID=UPI004045EFF0